MSDSAPLRLWQSVFSRLASLHHSGVLLPSAAAACVTTAALPLLAACALSPSAPHPIACAAIIVLSVAAFLLSGLALRASNPGFLLPEAESLLADESARAILARWSLKHAAIVSARDQAELSSIATGVGDGRMAGALTAVLQRMAAAQKVTDRAGADPDGSAVPASREMDEACAELQAVVRRDYVPSGGYSAAFLPPPPSRRLYLPPSGHKHAVLQYDADEAASAEAKLAPTLTRDERRARKKERKAKAEAERYAQRPREDGRESFEESKERAADELSAAELTEEELDDAGVRSRPGALPMPNPYASADAFFAHDFAARPLAEQERERLMARARLEQAQANTLSGRVAPTDAFFVGNPRWHPNKLRDDMERFERGPDGEVRQEACVECLLWRPLGARHCDRCHSCVEGFVSHSPLAGTCVGRGNVRFMLGAILSAMILAATAVWMMWTIVAAAHPLEWSSWRVSVPRSTLAQSDSAEELQERFSWNWLLLAELNLAAMWTAALVVTLVVWHFSLFDLVKHANYVLLAEGGGLRADAPGGRANMNALQLMLYADVGELIKFMFERVIFSPPEMRRQPEKRLKEVQQLARERRREWRAMREAQASNAAAVAAGEASVSPSGHHALDMSVQR